MARKKAPKRDSHVRLYWYETSCPAWHTLPPVAVKLLVILRTMYHPLKGNTVFLSEREAAARLNVSKKTASKAFDALLERGWIRQAEKGSFACKVSHASSYRLTDVPDASPGAEPTREYLRWKPEGEK